MYEKGIEDYQDEIDELKQENTKLKADMQQQIDNLESLHSEAMAEVWDLVIAGYLRYKQSLIPRPGCEKFPMPMLMGFEDWCRQQKEQI